MDHDTFDEIKKRSVFIHINIPGQEDGAEKFPDSFTFPTLQNIGEDLVTVLDQLRIKHVVVMGDGAGANIAARFAMMHVTRYIETRNSLKDDKNCRKKKINQFYFFVTLR